MSSWLSDIAGSHRVQLGVTAVLSGALAASAVIGLQEAKRRYDVHDLKDTIPDLKSPHEVGRINNIGGAEQEQSHENRDDERSAALARRARLGDYDEDLILEQLARNRVFLTDDGLKKLRKAFVVVVGCGGVGSHAAAALARSGCGRLRLIDFDQVTLSSLNRHAVATLADVGTPKVKCLQRRLEQIVPWTHFECRNELFSEKVAAAQLAPWEDGQTPTYVIDAIDNIDSKVALLHYCKTNGLPVISSMGAGCKSDPTRIFIGDISASTDDALAGSTRRKLRKRGVKDGIPVVFSSEKTGPGKAQLLPLPEDEFQKGSVGELGVLPDFRVRILPVLGTMPAMFGLCVANHVMLEIADYPHDYLPNKLREKMYEGILGQVQGMEEKIARHQGLDPLGLRLPVVADDVGYLVEEVYHGRSAISGLAARLALIRWRRPEGDWIDTRTPGQKSDVLKLEDLVCMTKDEMVKHEQLVMKEGKSPEDVYDKEVVELVEKRMQEERRMRHL
ncbi:Putative THIF-type NAD/FAD binding, ubiquitin-activating enzyme, ThiF/MoeB/HesA family [Septoria linicola]|uniref:THIF-type NAD/FAD binding, ubiquitin-activating enzyme, ThiF/MoeB/HesA family n=1 Tax=Septoria linicola TaxID=215465 RepID=A0A9Q9EJ74_9PEZI|nr:putative THIF-type NAD/FAD binding, ubiquitin-activating enzyme, ThiF/MoeB/HesA family [Septoria linicola]USW51857.1 Putative THIF-type NAD/FAD binding, ubiquitin-activating enzyme, ThiF/MoeB/HesA family [Septoria linicola]